ncbi:MAG: aminoacetone oxidase family FAD-binding enzyme, partial [Planctomycetes bacterium]|nr:aminoacetone oxidase family FAD-binding enzyme [Planctomycetota bacterium]
QGSLAMKTICVVGGGPAGLAAAIHAAMAGARVVLLEQNDGCGVKLTITGGGHCNLTNRRPAEEWPALFGRHGRFLQPALGFLSRPRLEAWFQDLGQPTAAADGFHVLPVSHSARAVRDALVATAREWGVRIRPSVRAVHLMTAGDRVQGVAAVGETVPADAVILATGGISYPATGSTGDGLTMARDVGHTIVPPCPGLVGLQIGNLSPELAGLVLFDAEVRFKQRGWPAQSGSGELLLTHRGVSGPAILDLSATVTQALDEREDPGRSVTLTLRWLAGKDERQWLVKLAEWRTAKGSSPVAALVRSFMPQKLARWLCEYAGVAEGTRTASLTAGQRDRLATALGCFPAAVTGHDGWDRAMITRGGVDVREITPHTLESRLLDGLYFAGEMLDMDGPCGGYNLHWAFASGALAGWSAAGGSPKAASGRVARTAVGITEEPEPEAVEVDGTIEVDGYQAHS